MSALADRSIRTDYDGGGTTGAAGSNTTLPSPGVASHAAADWRQANEALTFSINENLALYREARKNSDWSQAVSHLEGAAVAALKLGDVVLKQAVVEADVKPVTVLLDIGQLILCLRGMGLNHEAPPKHIAPPETSLVLDGPTPDYSDPTIAPPKTPNVKPGWWTLHKDWPHG